MPATNMSPTPDSLPFVLTVQEAAQLLRVNRTRAYELCKAGVLPHVRLGQQIRIPRDRLLAWLQGDGATFAVISLPTADLTVPHPAARSRGESA